MTERIDLHSLLQAIPDAVWLTSPDGIVRRCNPRFERLVGISAAEMTGSVSYDLFGPQLADSLRAADAEAVAAGCSVHDLWVNDAAGGDRIMLECTRTPMHDAGGVLLGLLTVARDVTATRQAAVALAQRVLEEEAAKLQARKLEAVGTMTAGTANEFNNALATICGYAEMTADLLPDDSVAKHNIAHILRAGFRAGDLIANLVAFALVDNPAKVLVDVVVQVRAALALLRAATRPQIQLTFHTGVKEGEATLLAEPTQFMQIVINLCINAAHAMENHGVISLSVDPAAAVKDSPPAYHRGICLTVADSGSREPSRPDLGVGLSVVQGIVADLGGVIQVRSSAVFADTGTQFLVYLPTSPTPAG